MHACYQPATPLLRLAAAAGAAALSLTLLGAIVLGLADDGTAWPAAVTAAITAGRPS
jgi:hypothetical protein